MFKISTKKLFFDSDDEFYRFAVVPELIPIEYTDSEGNVKYYTDFNLSNAYNDAISNGKQFVINDPNSQIFKHQAVSYRTITKPIENLYDCLDLF